MLSKKKPMCEVYEAPECLVEILIAENVVMTSVLDWENDLDPISA